ncbi:MAG: hypothetical protein AAFW68_12710 [Pseudomonadota bacterium]
MTTHTTSASWLALRFDAMRSLVRRPIIQRSAFVFALLIFGGGLWAATRAHPQLLQNLNLQFFALLVFVFSPAVIFVNAAIFKHTARMGGVSFNMGETLRLTVLSSALNHLPAPGGPVLRIAAMRARGGALETASVVNVGAALLWLGASFLFAGGWAVLFSNVLAAACLLIGMVSLVIGSAMCWRVRRRVRDALSILAMNCVNVLLYAAALWIGFLALGEPVSVSEASVISAAGVIGSSASFLPAGIGAREAAGAFLGSRIAIDPLIAFSATALVHLAMMATLAAAAASLTLTGAKLHTPS